MAEQSKRYKVIFMGNKKTTRKMFDLLREQAGRLVTNEQKDSWIFNCTQSGSDVKCKIEVWTSPMDDVTSPRDFYRRTHGAILVYDSTSSFFDLNGWMKNLFRENPPTGCTPVCALWGRKSEEGPVPNESVEGFLRNFPENFPKQLLCEEVDENNIMEEFQNFVHKLLSVPCEPETLLANLIQQDDERSCWCVKS